MDTREKLIEICKLLYERKLVVGKSGNASMRISDDKVLITPHNSSLGFIRKDALLLIDTDGNVLEGHSKPSLETPLHTEIYKNRPEINGVIHAHPPYSILISHLEIPLDLFNFEWKIFLSDIHTIPQNTPTVTDINPLLVALKSNCAAILKNHWVVSIGENIWDAFFQAELLEEAAMITFYKNIKGGQFEITDE